jgi:hypothetical protein
MTLRETPVLITANRFSTPAKTTGTSSFFRGVGSGGAVGVVYNLPTEHRTMSVERIDFV